MWGGWRWRRRRKTKMADHWPTEWEEEEGGGRPEACYARAEAIYNPFGKAAKTKRAAKKAVKGKIGTPSADWTYGTYDGFFKAVEDNLNDPTAGEAKAIQSLLKTAKSRLSTADGSLNLKSSERKELVKIADKLLVEAKAKSRGCFDASSSSVVVGFALLSVDIKDGNMRPSKFALPSVGSSATIAVTPHESLFIVPSKSLKSKIDGEAADEVRAGKITRFKGKEDTTIEVTLESKEADTEVFSFECRDRDHDDVDGSFEIESVGSTTQRSYYEEDSCISIKTVDMAPHTQVEMMMILKDGQWMAQPFAVADGKVEVYVSGGGIGQKPHVVGLEVLSLADLDPRMKATNFNFFNIEEKTVHLTLFAL